MERYIRRNSNYIVLFKIDIGRNSKNVVVTGTKLYIYLISLSISACDTENIQAS